MTAADWLHERTRIAEAATEAERRVGDAYAPMSGWIAEARVLRAEAAMDAKHAVVRAVAALRGVLELHRANDPADGNCQGYRAYGYGHLDSPWCVECSDQSWREYGVPWPCATARAISEALGVEP